MTTEHTPLGFETPVKQEFDGKPPPQRRDEVVVNRAVPKVAKILKDWDSTSNEPVEFYFPAAKDLCEEFEYDGYYLAKQLDHKGWDVDSYLVSELESVGIIMSDAYHSCRKEWIEHNKVKPELPIGFNVTFKSGWDNDLKGVIIAIDPVEGFYTVNCPSKNHRPGGGYIIAFEDALGTGRSVSDSELAALMGHRTPPPPKKKWWQRIFRR